MTDDTKPPRANADLFDPNAPFDAPVRVERERRRREREEFLRKYGLGGTEPNPLTEPFPVEEINAETVSRLHREGLRLRRILHKQLTPLRRISLRNWLMRLK